MKRFLGKLVFYLAQTCKIWWPNWPRFWRTLWFDCWACETKRNRETQWNKFSIRPKLRPQTGKGFKINCSFSSMLTYYSFFEYSISKTHSPWGHFDLLRKELTGPWIDAIEQKGSQDHMSTNVCSPGSQSSAKHPANTSNCDSAWLPCTPLRRLSCK